METMDRNFIRWPLAVVLMIVVQVRGMLDRFAQVLGRFLDEAWQAAFRADADALRAADSAAQVAIAERKAATIGVYEEAKRASRLLRGVRAAARARRPLDREIGRKLAVGLPASYRNVRSLLAALERQIETATAEPEKASALGITPEVLTALRDVRDSLLAAETSQEDKKRLAKEAVRRRDELHVRVETGIARIVAVGRMAFADQPTVAAQFAALIPGPRGRRTPAPAAGEGGETAPPAAPVAEAAE